MDALNVRIEKFRKQIGAPTPYRSYKVLRSLSAVLYGPYDSPAKWTMPLARVRKRACRLVYTLRDLWIRRGLARSGTRMVRVK